MNTRPVYRPKFRMIVIALGFDAFLFLAAYGAGHMAGAW